jgi:hypothetical protein
MLSSSDGLAYPSGVQGAEAFPTMRAGGADDRGVGGGLVASVTAAGV